MTLARSSTHLPLHLDFSDLEPKQETPIVPRFYPVMLHKVNGVWNEFYLGSVVTHLPLLDWCQMKGYKLVRQFIGSRDARPEERTNLL